METLNTVIEFVGSKSDGGSGSGGSGGGANLPVDFVNQNTAAATGDAISLIFIAVFAMILLCVFAFAVYKKKFVETGYNRSSTTAVKTTTKISAIACMLAIFLICLITAGFQVNNAMADTKNDTLIVDTCQNGEFIADERQHDASIANEHHHIESTVDSHQYDKSIADRYWDSTTTEKNQNDNFLTSDNKNKIAEASNIIKATVNETTGQITFENGFLNKCVGEKVNLVSLNVRYLDTIKIEDKCVWKVSVNNNTIYNDYIDKPVIGIEQEINSETLKFSVAGMTAQTAKSLIGKKVATVSFGVEKQIVPPPPPPPPPPKPETTVTFTGAVKNVSGQPAIGVDVFLMKKDGTVINKTKTKNDGTFVLDNIEKQSKGWIKFETYDEVAPDYYVESATKDINIGEKFLKPKVVIEANLDAVAAGELVQFSVNEDSYNAVIQKNGTYEISAAANEEGYAKLCDGKFIQVQQALSTKQANQNNISGPVFPLTLKKDAANISVNLPSADAVIKITFNNGFEYPLNITSTKYSMVVTPEIDGDISVYDPQKDVSYVSEFTTPKSSGTIDISPDFNNIRTVTVNLNKGSINLEDVPKGWQALQDAGLFSKKFCDGSSLFLLMKEWNTEKLIAPANSGTVFGKWNFNKEAKLVQDTEVLAIWQFCIEFNGDENILEFTDNKDQAISITEPYKVDCNKNFKFKVKVKDAQHYVDEVKIFNKVTKTENTVLPIDGVYTVKVQNNLKVSAFTDVLNNYMITLDLNGGSVDNHPDDWKEVTDNSNKVIAYTKEYNGDNKIFDIIGEWNSFTFTMPDKYINGFTPASGHVRHSSTISIIWGDKPVSHKQLKIDDALYAPVFPDGQPPQGIAFYSSQDDYKPLDVECMKDVAKNVALAPGLFYEGDSEFYCVRDVSEIFDVAIGSVEDYIKAQTYKGELQKSGDYWCGLKWGEKGGEMPKGGDPLICYEDKSLQVSADDLVTVYGYGESGFFDSAKWLSSVSKDYGYAYYWDAGTGAESFKDDGFRGAYFGILFSRLFNPQETLKAVYDKSEESLTFYYDKLSHTSENTIIYSEDQLDPQIIKPDVTKWPYRESEGRNAKKLVIDSSLEKYNTEARCFKATAYMFDGLIDVESFIGFEHFDVSHVLSMSNMFSGCAIQTSQVPDVSKWDTANVKYMDFVFCDFAHFNLSMNDVPDVSHWKTKNVVTFKGMFQYYGNCSNILTKVPCVSHVEGQEVWDTSSAIDMSAMFSYYGCSSSIFNDVPDVSNFNMGQVNNLSYMFYDYAKESKSITKVPDMSKWDLPVIEDCRFMFREYANSNAENVQEVFDFSGFDLIGFSKYMLDTPAIHKFKIGVGWNVSLEECNLPEIEAGGWYNQDTGTGPFKPAEILNDHRQPPPGPHTYVGGLTRGQI